MAAPLRLDGAEAIEWLLPEVIPFWPFHALADRSDAAPFFTIRGAPGAALLRCETHVEDRPARQFDPVNAVCDVIAALAFALPAEDQSLICLHAAGVVLAGRLVIFPNIRRAGKSTLSVALARAGHQLFSDDVVPVRFTPGGAVGLALGIAPRLRLPLPDAVGPDFRAWVEAVSGPRNRQYQYLRPAAQAAHGTTLPIGAFVILDRQDAPCEARLDPVPPDQAMDALLHQNFTRDRHSADVLQEVAGMLTDCPAYRLTYATLPEAVACLEAAFAVWPDPEPVAQAGSVRTLRVIDEATPRPGIVLSGARVQQRPGTVEVPIGATLYLADGDGQAIHRMDPLAEAIWGLLAEPAQQGAIIDLLADAFPAAGRDRICTDVARLLERLALEGLIEQVPD